MRSRTRRGRCSSRGFTLIEFGIVLAVGSILIAMILPDMIQLMRNRMAEKAADDVSSLQDMARMFHQTQQLWPGEAVPPINTNSRGCIAVGAPIAALQGQFPGITLRTDNAWGEPYRAGFFLPAGAFDGIGRAGCLFGVVTDVPDVVSELFISLLPNAACNGHVGGLAGNEEPCQLPPPQPPLGLGMRRCCSYVPRPGATMISPCVLPTRLIPDPFGDLICQ